MAFNHDGRVLRPLPKDEDLCGGVTKSMGDSGASMEFRCRFLTWPASAQIRAIILCTDGVANSYSPESLNAFGKGVIEAISKDREYALAQLADWLPELSRRGSFDDVSIAGLITERRFLTQSRKLLPIIKKCR